MFTVQKKGIKKMKKDFTRDYTVEMFRLWSALGCPCSAEILSHLAEHTPPIPKTETIDVKRNNSVNTDINYEIHAAGVKELSAVREADTEFAALLDALAAAQTVEALKKCGKEHIISAIVSVYLTSPRKKLAKGDISDRIRRFAASLPSDERSVYRWLKEGRRLCASMRGLRVS